MKEIFKKYYVTEDGKVFNKFKQLSPVFNGRGYLVLGLMIDGKRKTIAIHRLVALAFIDNPNNLPEVNHIDGNRTNNSVSNLEWISHSDNIRHSYNLENRSAVGANNANCKYNEKTIREICEYLVKGLKSSEIRDLGYNYSLVRSVKRRKNWTHISKNYNF